MADEAAKQENPISAMIAKKYDVSTQLTPQEWDIIAGQIMRDISDLFAEDLKSPELGTLVGLLQKAGILDSVIDRTLAKFFETRETRLYDAVQRKATEFELMIYTFHERIVMKNYQVDEIVNIPDTEEKFPDLPKEHKEFGKPDYLNYMTKINADGNLIIEVHHKYLSKRTRNNRTDYTRENKRIMQITAYKEQVNKLPTRSPSNIRERIKWKYHRWRNGEPKPIVTPRKITMYAQDCGNSNPTQVLAKHAAIMQSENKMEQEIVAFALENLPQALFKDLDGAVQYLQSFSFKPE